MLKRLVILAGVMLAPCLAGCQATGFRNEAELAHDCERLGYKRGTESFLRCYELQAMREEAAQRRRLAAGAALMEMSRPSVVQVAPQTCTAMRTGNMITQTCN